MQTNKTKPHHNFFIPDNVSVLFQFLCYPFVFSGPNPPAHIQASAVSFFPQI